MNNETAAMTKVTEKAVLRRVNLALKRDGGMDGDVLRRNVRSTELGPYYAVCIRQNAVVAKNVALEAWARELGVLRENEEMLPEE